MIGASAKRMKLANYMSSLPEIYEVIEDNLGEDNPSIKLQTKSRVISLECDDKGKVIEAFEMREGCGLKEDFLVKQKAYNTVREYYEDYYTGARILKQSFEEGLIKLQVDDRTVTLSYNPLTNCVDETDRVRHRTKRTETKKDEPKLDTLEYNQMSIFDVKSSDALKTEDLKEKEMTYNKWSEGLTVVNKYNGKCYTVKKDSGNIIEVRDQEYGYLTMARADLEIKN